MKEISQGDSICRIIEDTAQGLRKNEDNIIKEMMQAKEIPKDGRAYLVWLKERGSHTVCWDERKQLWRSASCECDAYWASGIIENDAERYMDEKGAWHELNS